MSEDRFKRLKVNHSKYGKASKTDHRQVTISKFFETKILKRDVGVTAKDEENEVIILKDDSSNSTDTEADSACRSSRKRNQFFEDNLSEKRACLKLQNTSDQRSSKAAENETQNQCTGVQLSDTTKNKLKLFELESQPGPEVSTSSYSVLKGMNEKKKFDIHTTYHSPEKNAKVNVSDEDEDTSPLVKKSSSKVSPIIQRSKSKYTPLELQFLKLKEKYPDAILFVECGYKYRFFGDDAEIAAKVLKIYAHLDHNFMTASIPTIRLFVHVRRLVAAGYKVGVVKQTETAAIKAAGDNKSAPFSRELKALYTKSTLIGEDIDTEEDKTENNTFGASPTTSYLMCLYEVPDVNAKSKVQEIGVLAVQPSSGDIIYDSFHDDSMRSGLEMRMTHIQPVELLLPAELSVETEEFIRRYVELSCGDQDGLRTEHLPNVKMNHSTAFETVSEFFEDENPSRGAMQLKELSDLPQSVITCLAGSFNYLKDFDLHHIFRMQCKFEKFSLWSDYMKLPASTVKNLELFCNQTNGKENGSLFSVMNRTTTKFGAALLKKWLSHPLKNQKEIIERQEAISEMIAGSCACQFSNVKTLLSKLPDLNKSLGSIFHKKCSVLEFYQVCSSLSQLVDDLKPLLGSIQQHLSSKLLRLIFSELPDLLSDTKVYCSALNPQAVKEKDKTQLFMDENQFPSIVSRKQSINKVEQELHDHRREVRLVLRQPGLEYTTVLGTEYLVEVKKPNLSLVPKDWTVISSTKSVTRYHSPFIERKYKELNKLREQLNLDCHQAWLNFLSYFIKDYHRYKKAVHLLSTLDCILSLADVARSHGYCRPDIVNEFEQKIVIHNGCHPIIQHLLAENEQFVPNETDLRSSKERVMVITGPNMGGKSSYIKQVALIVIMAQMGSYVPADAAQISLFDAVYTRMGASDEINRRCSTFMVELQEASTILQQATSKSIVVLDELGRGTSTHDGVAIAWATLKYFISDVQCLCMFVTHYPSLSVFETQYPGIVGNYHMSFLVNKENSSNTESGVAVITFLYQLVRGSAQRSYGLNVAKLASMPDHVIIIAAKKSALMEHRLNEARCCLETFHALFTSSCEEIKDIVEELQDI